MNHSLLLKTLGMALVHSLWQYGFLWMVFLLVTHSFKKTGAGFRHGLALLLSTAGLAWFLSGFLTGSNEMSPIAENENPALGWPVAVVNRQLAGQFILCITYVYLVVTAVQFARFFFSFYRSHALYHSGLAKPGAGICMYVSRIALQLNIRMNVQVFISSYVDTPLVIGFLKPTILLPFACINRLTVLQLEAILLHELSHIRRNDYLVNIYIASMEILFFFNPFARLLFRQVKKEREYSCDDQVMQHQYNPHSYATALLTLEQSRTGYLKTGLAATGASRKILLQRVQRILQVKTASRYSLNHIPNCLAALAICGLLVVLHPAGTPPAKADQAPFLHALARKVPLHIKLHRTNDLPPLYVHTIHAETGQASVPRTGTGGKWQKPASVRAGDPESLVAALLDEAPEYAVINTDVVNMEKRSFSLPEAVEPELPAAASTYTFPYIPSSSFYSVDTSGPPSKSEPYHAHAATQSYLQARKALDQINWKAIQKRLPASVSIDSLRMEIERSIAQVNWQRINEEITDSLDVQHSLAGQAAIDNQLQEMKKWKYQQQRLDLLQNRLQLQQKALQKDAEKKALELQKQLAATKVIIYL